MKLCPCGYAGDTTRVCRCAENEIHRYRSRLSGPLLDRIDLHVTLAPVPLRTLGGSNSTEGSNAVRGRVEAARMRQRSRYATNGHSTCNGQASGRKLLPTLDSDARELLDSAAESLALSARAYHRVIKVARTVADLAHADRVEEPHVAEALRFRPRVSASASSKS